MKTNSARNKAKIYTVMYVNFIIYSLCLVVANFAGQHPLFSFNALALYFVAFFLLGVYAIVWQQVLKHMPLTIAYTSKAVTIVFGMFWGVILFSERITLQMIIGVTIIISGVLLVVSYDK